MDEEIRDLAYAGVRFVEAISIAVFIFGVLWEGTEVLMLTMPQFMMLYGGIGAVVSEVVARVLKKK